MSGQPGTSSRALDADSRADRAPDHAADGAAGLTAPFADTPPQRRTGPRARPLLKAPKARSAAECERLEQLPNIGPALAADLRLLGVRHPADLAGRDAFALYRELCAATGERQDPCVLDTFLAIVDFMRGGPPRPWWAYTSARKATYGAL